MDENFICIPISSEVYNELVLRKGRPNTDVPSWIEQVVQNYLDSTADDKGWSEAYYEWRSQTHDLVAFTEKFGDPAKGYHWGRTFLPNGTKIAMKYKDQQYDAAVTH